MVPPGVGGFEAADIQGGTGGGVGTAGKGETKRTNIAGKEIFTAPDRSLYMIDKRMALCPFEATGTRIFRGRETKRLADVPGSVWAELGRSEHAGDERWIWTLWRWW